MSTIKAIELAEITAATNASTASKVVPLHQSMQEEQTKNSTNAADSAGRARKSMLPASDLAKVPSGEGSDSSALSQIEQELLEQIQQSQNLSAAQKKEIETKLKSGLSEIKKSALQLATAIDASKSQSPAATPAEQGATPKAGVQTPSSTPTYDAWNQSILMLFQSFATNQMNQNNLVENGWVSQQQAQNTTLQDAASGENALANASTTDKHASVMHCLLIGLGVAAVLLIVGAVTFFTGGLAAIGIAGLAAGATVFGGAALAGGIIGGSCYAAAAANPTSSANAGITETGPDESQMENIQNENTFWSMISQKANNMISTGSQTDVVNASSNNTTLGQQASQAIQALGQVMQTPVAH